MVGLVMVEAVSTSKLSVLQSEWRNREVAVSLVGVVRGRCVGGGVGCMIRQ